MKKIKFNLTGYHEYPFLEDLYGIANFKTLLLEALSSETNNGVSCCYYKKNTFQNIFLTKFYVTSRKKTLQGVLVEFEY